MAYDKAAKEADAAKKKYDDLARRPNSALTSLKNMMKGTDTEERLEKARPGITAGNHVFWYFWLTAIPYTIVKRKVEGCFKEIG